MLQDVRLQFDRLLTKQKLLRDESGGRDKKSLDFFVSIITRVTDAERCGIFIHDPESATTWLKAGTDVTEHQIEVPTSHSVVGQVIARGEAVFENDMEAKPGIHKAVDATTGFNTRSLLCVPIRSCDRNEVIGAIEVLNKRSGPGFTAEDQDILEQVADHIRLNLDRVFLQQEVFGLLERVMRVMGRMVAGVLGAVGLGLLAMVLVFLFVLIGPTLG